MSHFNIHVTGNSDLQSDTLFQVFWFIINLSMVAILNFLVNLRTVGDLDFVASFYDFLNLDEVVVIKQTLVFNAIIMTVIFSGSISIVLYFVQIRSSQSGYSLLDVTIEDVPKENETLVSKSTTLTTLKSTRI